LELPCVILSPLILISAYLKISRLIIDIKLIKSTNKFSVLQPCFSVNIPMRKLIILISILTIDSCSQIEKRGYAFDLSDYQLVKEGLTSQELLIQNMGSPTLVSEIDNKEEWIYFSEDVRKLLFFKPKILNRKIMVVNFDKGGAISKIDNYDLANENSINFANNYTTVKSNKKGFWSQIFGNIGQVRAN
jgi:outer membrane protein assembly factor BamE (lipoprotein component of BamABCDE complex)